MNRIPKESCGDPTSADDLDGESTMVGGIADSFQTVIELEPDDVNELRASAGAGAPLSVPANSHLLTSLCHGHF